jgi:hypothetical protein
LPPALGLYKDQICCGQQEQILFGQKGQNYMAFPGNDKITIEAKWQIKK